MDKKQTEKLIAQWYHESSTFGRKFAVAILWLKHKIGFKVTVGDLRALPAD